jgi:hypothetical protein
VKQEFEGRQRGMRSGCRFTDNKTGNIRRDHDHNDVEQKRPEKKPKDNDQPIGGPDYPSDSGGRMSSGRSLPRCLEFFWTVGDRSAEEFRRTDGCHEDGVIRQAKMQTACAARDARSDSGGDELFVAWGRRVKEQRKRRCTLASTYMIVIFVRVFLCYKNRNYSLRPGVFVELGRAAGGRSTVITKLLNSFLLWYPIKIIVIIVVFQMYQS